MTSSTFALKDLGRTVGSRFDYFICCASFEDRCKSIADQLDPREIGYAVIAENANLRKYVGANSNYLVQRFAHRHARALMDTDDPIRSADALADALAALRAEDRGDRCLVDISTFTHESLLILFRILEFWVDDRTTIDFVYTRASDYSLKDDPEDKWLSRGIREVRSVIGYPGELSPLRTTHLIILVGFEYDRALSLIREYEPSLISLGRAKHGKPPDRELIQVIDRRIERIRGQVANVAEFEFPCLDALGTAEAIKRQVAQVGSYNTVIAPMNTKVSTLGAAHYAIQNPEVQLCYAQAELYNYANYSRPGEKCLHIPKAVFHDRALARS